jgi:MFS family permease
VAGALLTPGSLAIVQAAFRPEDRGRAIGTWAGFTSLAPVLGPVVGGWLTAVDWRLVFLLNLPLIAVAVALTLRYVPESRDESSTGRVDWLGAALAAVGLAGLTVALTSEPRLAAGVVGVSATAAFVWWQARAADPMVPLSLFANRTFSATNALTLVVYAALAGVSFFLALQLQTTLGYTPLQAGLATVPSTLLLALLSSRTGDLAVRVGPRLPLTAGPVTAAAGVTMLAWLGPGDTYVVDALPGILLFGLGLALLVAPLTTTVLAAAPARLTGTASGVNNAVSRTGGLLAVAALPALVGLGAQDYVDPGALTEGYRLAMLLCGGLLVLGAGFGALVPRRLAEGV